MTLNEKGHHEGGPIPNDVWQDIAESKSALLKTQVFCRLYAISKREGPRSELIGHHGQTVVRYGRCKADSEGALACLGCDRGVA